MNAISQIETGVPLPTRRARRGEYRYPFAQMRPGDSILCEGNAHNAQKAAYDAGQRFGWRFASRTVVVNGQKACRIWRLT